MGVIDKVKKRLWKESSDVPDTGEVPAAAEVSQAVDLPSTVQALTVDARHLAELRGVFSGQKWDSPVETSAEIYIWRKADEYIKSWLPNKGYAISESAVFDDCVGYRCVRNGVAYTVFMFAYGKNESSLPSGEYCSKFKSFPFAEYSIVLITCLQVDRKVTADGAEYTIGRCGRTDLEPELWRVNDINGMPILEYFPRMEMMAQTWQFMYAFNHECTDVYDCIITDDNPSIAGAPECSGKLVNDAFYEELRRMHREYGNMKRGYVRYGDRIYSAIPYVDGLGFFSWSSFDATNRMHNITLHPFDGGEQKVREFIKAGQREPENLFAHIPELIKAVPLPPTEPERFSVKLSSTTANGEDMCCPFPHRTLLRRSFLIKDMFSPTASGPRFPLSRTTRADTRAIPSAARQSRSKTAFLSPELSAILKASRTPSPSSRMKSCIPTKSAEFASFGHGTSRPCTRTTRPASSRF